MEVPAKSRSGFVIRSLARTALAASLFLVAAAATAGDYDPMPHPVKQLLDRRQRRTAQTIKATFLSDISSNWSSIKLKATGAIVNATRAISIPIAAGQDVIVSRVDGSGLAENTGYTIIGLANAQLDTSSPVVEERQHIGASITSISPNPAVLLAGESVGITILGIGFTTVPTFEIKPAYGSPSLADLFDPLASFSDNEIDCDVQSAIDMAAGDYSLNVGTLDSEPIYFQISGNPLRSFTVTAPSEVQVDAPFSMTVTAIDLHGATYTGYRGTILVSSNALFGEGGGTGGFAYAFTATDAGTHTFTDAEFVSLSGVAYSGSRPINVVDQRVPSATGTTTTIVDPAHSLWLAALDQSAGGQARVFRIAGDTVQVFRHYDYPAPITPHVQATSGLVIHGGILYARGDDRMMRITAVGAGGQLSDITGLQQVNGHALCNWGTFGTFLAAYWGSNTGITLNRYDTSTNVETLLSMLDVGASSVAIDPSGTTAWVCDGQRVGVVDLTTGETGYEATAVPGGRNAIAVDSNYVYILGNGTATFGGGFGTMTGVLIYICNKSLAPAGSLTVVRTLLVTWAFSGPAPTCNNRNVMMFDGAGNLYGTASDANYKKFFCFHNPATAPGFVPTGGGDFGIGVFAGAFSPDHARGLSIVPHVNAALGTDTDIYILLQKGNDAAVAVTQMHSATGSDGPNGNPSFATSGYSLVGAADVQSLVYE